MSYSEGPLHIVQVSGEVGRLAAVLDKPLRPIWLSQESRMWLNAMTDRTDLPFTPLYLVSASKPSHQRESISLSLLHLPGRLLHNSALLLPSAVACSANAVPM